MDASEPVAFTSDGDDVTVVQPSVEDGGGDDGIKAQHGPAAPAHAEQFDPEHLPSTVCP